MKKYCPSSESRNNFFLVLGVQAQKFFLIPLLVLSIAAVVSQQQFGNFILGFTLSQLVMLCCDFGMNHKIFADSRGEFPELNLIFSILMLKVSLSLLFLVIFLVGTLCFFEKEFSTYWVWVVSGVIISMCNFIWSIYKSEKNFVLEFQAATINSFCLIVLLIFCYFIFDLTPIALSVIFLLSRLTSLLWSVIALLNTLKSKDMIYLSFNKYLEMSIEIFKTVIPLAGMTIFAFGYIYLDLFVIEYFLNSETVAVYQLAFRLIMLSMIAPEIFNNLLLPTLSKNVKENSLIFASTIKSSQLILVLYSLIVGFLLFFFAGPFIHYFFGSEYDDSMTLVKSLIPIILLRCFGAPIGAALLVMGKLWYRFFALLSIAIIGLMANYVLLPIYGLDGVVFVSIAVHVLLNAFYWVVFQRYSKKLNI